MTKLMRRIHLWSDDNKRLRYLKDMTYPNHDKYELISETSNYMNVMIVQNVL